MRIIADTSEAAVERAALLRNSFKDAVIHLKYGVREVEEEEIVSAIKSVCDESVQCIVKEQKLDNLQNGLLPFCLGYDTFPSSVDEWSRLFEILINHPNCAVSIQLMPVQLLAQEAFELDRYMQVLNTLSNGIMEMGVGNISNSLAKKHAQQYSYYSERKHGSLFVFNAVVMGHRSAATSIANCLAGVLATGEQSSIDLKTVSLSHDTVNKDKNFYPLPWAVNEALKAQESASYIWQSQKIGNNMFRFPFIVSVEEATELFRLPIGTSNVYAGFVVNGAQKDSKTYGEDIINAGDIVVGHLKSSAREDNIGFSLNDLTKHMLVVGTPGSGKTTFSIGVLDRLWKEHHIPFLVIEPAKNEYRALLHSIPDLQVFTPGKFSISPFVFNPFVLPKNVTLEAYKHTLKTAFAAAVTMTTPLDLIFEESINNCYSDYRWLDTSTAENGG
ncbi:MAG: DUF87 domain-containing protein, partial [Clostridia bacterium]|nr:DUF87 domain-containing protein [Clostridia bacterium]